MNISVASGKGGTGKTLAATSLALSLKDKYRVQLLDCDVEEPNDHLFLNPAITETKTVCVPVPKIDESKCTHYGKCSEVCAYHAIVVSLKNVLVFPPLCHGCGARSYLCPEKAITEEAKELGIVETWQADVIAKIPLDKVFTEAMIHGLPVAKYSNGKVSKQINLLRQNIADRLRSN